MNKVRVRSHFYKNKSEESSLTMTYLLLQAICLLNKRRISSVLDIASGRNRGLCIWGWYCVYELYGHISWRLLMWHFLNFFLQDKNLSFGLFRMWVLWVTCRCDRDCCCRVIYFSAIALTLLSFKRTVTLPNYRHQTNLLEQKDPPRNAYKSV